MHHRQPAFKALMGEARRGLQWLYQTQSDVLMLATTGTGGMEAAIINVASPGDRALVLTGGKFGQRWADVGEAFGLDVTRHEIAWGQAAVPDEVSATLDAMGDVHMVVITANETSTGTVHPTAEIVKRVRAHRPEAIIIVDAITALGVYDLPFDALDVDLMVCGSQKAFGLPPGLATIAVSERGWRAADAATLPRYFFDLRRERSAQAKNQTAFTSAISLTVGLCDVLEIMQARGLQALFAQQARLADAVRAGALALGMRLFSEAPSNSVTAVRVPEGVDPSALVTLLRDTYGVAIAGGQDHVKKTIVRLGHLGFIDDQDVLLTFMRLEKALRDLGVDTFEPAASLSAAARVLVR